MKSSIRTFSLGALLFFSAPVLCSEAQNDPENLPKPVEQLFEKELNQVMGREPAAVDTSKHKAMLKEVLDLIAKGSENVRFESSLLFEKIVAPSDVIQLIEALPLYSATPPAQIAIIRALGKIGDPIAFGALKKEYTFKNKPVQLAILETFATFHDDTIVPFLSIALRDSVDPDVQREALISLGKIGDAQAAYAIKSSYNILPPGSPQVTAQWALDLLEGRHDKNQTDTNISIGKKQFLYYKGMLYFLYRPVPLKNDEPNPWLLVCAHGGDFNVEQTFDTCFGIAKQYRLALLVPFFDPLVFPNYENFNIGGERSDKRFFELVDHVRTAANITTREMYMFGFEKGGEFVQRLTMAYPDRVARSAFFTKNFFNPDPERYYPNGTKPSPLAPDIAVDLSKVIKTDFAILIDGPMGSSKAYKTYYGALAAQAWKGEQTSRVRPRSINQDQVNLQRAWDAAHPYLFSTCS